MTPALHTLMLAWLDSADELERRHAANRLSLADAVEFERSGVDTTFVHPPTVVFATPAPLVPLADSLHAQRYGGLKCWFAEATPGCGCSGFHCHLLGRDGVTLRDCIACLRAR